VEWKIDGKGCRLLKSDKNKVVASLALYFEDDDIIKNEFKKCNYYNINKSIKRDQSLNEKLYKEFIELFQDKKTSGKKWYIEKSSLMEKLKSDDNNLFSYLIRLKIALDSENQQWLLKEIKSISNMSDVQAIISLSNIAFDKKEVNLFRDTIIKLAKEVYEYLGDKKLDSIFKTSLSRIFDKDIFNEIKSRWTLNEIRKVVSINRYRSNYPATWHSLLESRTSKAEVISILDKAYSGRLFKRLGFYSYWIFKYYFPRDKKIERYIINKIVEKYSYKNKSLYDEYILILLLENSYIKRILQGHFPELKRPMFVLKREYYNKLLQSGRGGLFAMYNLLKLGDTDMNHMKWVVGNE